MATFTINVDGRDVPARSGQTILQACRQAGIHIPVLCYEPRLSPLGTCRLCTVEVDGAGLTISCSTMAAEGMVVRTGSEGIIAARKARVEQLAADHYGDCLAPCHADCPAGIDVQGYIALVSRGRYQEAVDLIGEAIPLPAVCGRVCPHPCETVCRRSLVDDPVAINNLKRFASQHSGPVSFVHLRPLPPSSHRVAVVGAGPAGLAAAYFLALSGHSVTVFEAHPLAGGMLRYGIPAYRLPKDVLDREIAHVLSLGISLNTNQRLGQHFTLKGLFDQGFQAVFVATGASGSATLGIPGEHLEGVFSGIDFLFKVASNVPVHPGQRVAVIGGGNTAVDAARTAHRLGAHEVTILYRRSRSQMPAISDEVAEAEKEGVRLHCQVAPVRLEGSGGRVERLICQKTALGLSDASGRPAPEPVPGSDFVLPVDSVVAAAGQQPDLSWLAREPAELSAILAQGQGRILVTDKDTFATPVRGVFAGGDAVSGPATAIEAMAAGKKAAVAIDHYLKGQSLPKKYQFNSVKGKPSEIDRAEYQNVPVSHRQPMPEIPLDARHGNFKEVAAGYTETEARTEAARCLQCGCSAIEKCTLRSLATEYAIAAPPARKDRFHFPVDNSNPFVERDDNKCVLCSVCARVCREVLGVGALPSTFRVAEKSAIVPLTRTACITCGECTAVCPVGAMSPARDVRPAFEVSTICPYCAVGCGLILGVRGGTIVSARGEPLSPVSRGNLCFRGRFGYEFVNHHDRLTHPLVRRHGKLVKAAWEDALELVAGKLALYKGDQFATLTSGKLLNEENYILQEFTREVMGGEQLTANSFQLSVGQAFQPVPQSVGRASLPIHIMSTWSGQFSGAPPVPAISDLARSSCFLVIGTDLSTSFPVLWLELRRAVQNGATLLVIDPRETEAARLANLWLRPRPGTDVALIAGMIKIMADENLLDTQFIQSRALGFEALRNSVREFSPERVEKVTGVPADRVIDAAYSFIQNRPGMIVCGSGVSRQEDSTALAAALGDLAILASDAGRTGFPACPGDTGVPARPDRPVGGLFYLMGQNNARGASASTTGFPACRTEGLPADPGIPSTTGFPACRPAPVPAFPTPGLSQQVKAAYIVAANPVRSAGARAALEKLDFLVVQDLFLTETAALAHVVLPAASFAEKEGTFTNLERRTQKLRAAVPPAGEARPDWWITSAIARKMGAAGFDFAGAAEIAPRMNSHPQPDAAEPLSPLKLLPLSFEPRPAPGDYPFTLITGKHLYHFNTGTMTGRLPGIGALAGGLAAEMHPEDASALQVETGTRVRLLSPRGQLDLPARVTDRCPRSAVCLTTSLPPGKTEDLARLLDATHVAIQTTDKHE